MIHKSVSVAAVMILLAGAILAQGSGKSMKKGEIPFFGNETCPVSGKPVVKKHFATRNGERIYVCCGRCKKKVKADFGKYRKVAYPKAKAVGNQTCPLTGKPVDPKISVDFQGHSVGVCCKRCAKAFMKEPRKRLALARNPKLKLVGNKICPVMAAEKEAVSDDCFLIHDGRIINLCCEGCVEDFNKNPARYVKVLGIKRGKGSGTGTGKGRGRGGR